MKGKGQDSTSDSEEAALNSSKKKKAFPISELAFKVRKEDILVKADIKIKDPIKLPGVKATELKLMVDTIGLYEKWVTLSGGFDLDVNVPKFSGLDLKLVSYRLKLNTIEIMADLGTGIALDPYQIISISKIGGGVDQLAKGSDKFEIYVKGVAGVKTSAMLHLNNNISLPKVIEELIIFDNMEMRVQPVSMLKVSSDLKILGTKLLDITMIVNKDGFKATSTIGIDVDFIGMKMNMSGTEAITINANGIYSSMTGNLKRVKFGKLDIKNQHGFIDISIANRKLMLEAGYKAETNVSTKVVFNLEKGCWFIPEIS